MGENSEISWTHHTFNPWMGCSKVSEGCAHCYAETLMDTRYGKVQWGPNGTRVRTSESNWRKPLAWDRAAKKAGERHRVFCSSLADVFEDWQGPIVGSGFDDEELAIDDERTRLMTMDDVRRDLFDLIDSTPNLDWLLLTKRPENIERMVLDTCRGGGWWARSKNIWFGTSVEDQKRADERIPELLKIPAAVRFLSMEPLLGPVDLTSIQTKSHWAFKAEPSKLNALRGYTYSRRERLVLNGIVEERGETNFVDTECESVSWVIVGGESGQGARPCNLQWIRTLLIQCQAAGVPCFVKQLGAEPYNPPQGAFDPFNEVWSMPEIKDSKGGDWDEWPEYLRVREFPLVVAGG